MLRSGSRSGTVGCSSRCCVSGGSVMCRSSVLSRGGVVRMGSVRCGGLGRVIVIVVTTTATRAIIEAPINCNDTETNIRKVLEEAYRQIYTG